MRSPAHLRKFRFVAACVLIAAIATVTRADPPNLGDLKSQLVAYHDSGAYESDIWAVDAQAMAYLVERAHKVKKPALVLDIDETSLSNWEVIVANDFGYLDRISCDLLPKGSCNAGEQSKLIPCDTLPKGPCGWEAYDRTSRAPAIRPTLDLAQKASAEHVALFFITGRHEAERSVTEENLRKVGYPEWAHLYMRPDGTSTKSAADYKAPLRKAIEEEGYTIIVNVGDQASDLIGGHAERSFLLPDPFYRIP
jgi:predicted secreted acid phosphatase